MKEHKNFLNFSLCLIATLALLSCNKSSKKEAIRDSNLPIKEIRAEEIWVDMLVEIPAGSILKNELNKTTNKIEPDSINGKVRLINYLGYPANYGMIPKTLLPYEMGGDGDPLDILAIGPPAEVGSTIRVKLIGVLNLLDNGEHDDKLIAISEGSNLQNIQSINQLKSNFPGILQIIELWFQNYKGKDQMVSSGFAENKVAYKILQRSINAYEELGK